MALVHRGPALPEDRMLISFDVDCGELVPGHSFIARGVAYQPPTADGRRRVSLEYELVPGVTLEEESKLGRLDFIVGIDCSSDPPMAYSPGDLGAIAPFVGGETTHGSRGSWPLLRDTYELRFTITGRSVAASDRAPTGTLFVNLRESSVHWNRTS